MPNNDPPLRHRLALLDIRINRGHTLQHLRIPLTRRLKINRRQKISLNTHPQILHINLDPLLKLRNFRQQLIKPAVILFINLVPIRLLSVRQQLHLFFLRRCIQFLNLLIKPVQIIQFISNFQMSRLPGPDPSGPSKGE